MNASITTNPYPTSVLAALRALVPHRPLTFREADLLVELQANRFRDLLGIDEPLLPAEAITSLPRIAVGYDFDLPVSGLAQWSNGRWLIAINGQESAERQRFSLAHELFHIINHTTGMWLHPDRPHLGGAEAGEHLADYFAACLLMPKRHVKRLFYEGGSRDQLAAVFEVSPLAMQVRLSQLGLVTTPRCTRPSSPWPARGRTYRRALPALVQAAA